MSRNDESKSKAASDAITLLNFMNVSFSGIDLSNIRIPHANLSNSIVDGANFTCANLDGVNLTNSMHGDCIFDKTTMYNMKFGIPHDKLEGHTRGIRSVCSIQGPNGEKWLASGSDDKTIRIWNMTTGNQIHNLQKSEVTYTQGNYLVKKENPDEIIAIFNKPTDPMNLIDTNTISDGKTVRIIGPRKLQGGNIQLRNVTGLSQFNKQLLLSIGAVSFDEDFVNYCDEGKYTNFQAQMMAESYEHGWGVELNSETAAGWRMKVPQ